MLCTVTNECDRKDMCATTDEITRGLQIRMKIKFFIADKKA